MAKEHQIFLTQLEPLPELARAVAAVVQVPQVPLVQETAVRVVTD